MKQYSLFLFLLLLIGACSDDKIVPAKGDKIITLIIDQAVNTTASGDWLIIHGTDGRLLFSKLFDSGDTVIFQSDQVLDGKVNVTLFNYTTQNLQRYFELNTYLHVPVGEVWTIKNKPIDPFYQYNAGNFTVTAEDVQADTDIVLSDRFGNTNTFEYVPPYTRTYVSKSNLYTDASDFLLTMRDPQDNMRYAFLPEVKATSSYSFSFATMNEPEIIQQVSFPMSDSFYLSVEGLEDGQPRTQSGYRMLQHAEQNTSRTQINIGYLNRFSYYHTNFGIDYHDTRYQYEKWGTRADAIVLPVDAQFTITNPSVTNFAYATNSDFIRRESLWSVWTYYKNNDIRAITNWHVHGADAVEQKIKELPPQFKTIYPDFSMDDLLHTRTSFYLSGAVTFSDIIDSTFKGKTLPVDHETYSVELD